MKNVKFYNDIYVNHLKKLIENRKRFLKLDKNKTFIKCKCGKIITYNGITSHYVSCKYAMESKWRWIENNFQFPNFCPICGKEKEWHTETKILHDKLVTCSSKCYYKLKEIITTPKRTCVICNRQYYSKYKNSKVCSEKCYHKYLGIRIKDFWNRTDSEAEDIKRKRSLNISKATKGKKKKSPWNLGLKGYEYIKHFIKEDGRNTLYESLQKNDGWYKPSQIEIKFKDHIEKIIEEFNNRYQTDHKINSPFFTQNKQYDIIISMSKNIIIIEIDGDYWHKSFSLIEYGYYYLEDILEARAEDCKKDLIIRNLKHTHKTFDIIRFWELDIKENLETKISDLILQLLEADYNGDKKKFESTIQEIKKRYLEKGGLYLRF